ncbi:type I polyketide synthase [Virgisporangium aurantiacum]|uniref:Acyl transferase domain-containing protein n=1 Tax=Virgisporangium aurantiacum TaxID=175570 RepID=A0A8J3ZHV7_9ACTN|nr:type I polyketide synthase [Virgisporangium aurantiacum]GIJ63217.1 hypothetical protein Vau01_107330 [Virgisporangium aurantiacum]
MTNYAEAEPEGVEPVAIVGMACRLPGAADVEELWRNLVDGVVPMRTLSRDELLAAGVAADVADDPAYVPVTYPLDEMESFDHDLFGMSRREATFADPQIRLFIELAHSALEHAGYDPRSYAGDIGVYGGAGTGKYLWGHLYRNRRLMELAVDTLGMSTANLPDFVTTTTSYRLGLRGPSVNVYTACSTSLVALHLACEALRAGECELALAGGTSVELPHNVGYTHSEGSVESADGRCRPFDAGATGTVWASGGAMVLLKRLSDAVADGDPVHAVVLGNAINNDGAAKIGFSAPSVDGQSAAIAAALGAAGVDPRTVSYIEAHGTGTALGDPIEVAALSAVYGRNTDETGWCGLGSLKSNMGHLSQAAGVAGVIKTALALGRGLIPPSVGFESPNPAIDFASSPFYVNTTLSKWDTGPTPRRAAVSSFGIGGTNAHVVLEEPPARVRTPSTRSAHVVQVSARTPEALAAAVDRLAGHLAEHPDLDLADVAHTLRAGRRAYVHRTAVVARDTVDAAGALAAPRRSLTGAGNHLPPNVVWLFSGQGSQYAGMGAELYRAEPVFRSTVDECADVLGDGLGTDLRELIFATGPAADERLRHTGLTQPALFTVEYALARLWWSWGVVPNAMVGHSIGEYVAATVAGVFAAPDALRLVATRGRLMQALPAGSMLAVQLAEDELAGRLPAGLAIAVVNGPGACVVSGPTDELDAFAAELTAARVSSRALRTSHAFHSPMMEPILAAFTAAVADTPRSAPVLPFLSNVTGDWITTEAATDPSYWAGQLRGTVRFGDSVARLVGTGDEWAFVELGPGRQLAGLTRMQTAKTTPVLPTIPGRGEKGDPLATCYTAAAHLWAHGVDLDPRALGERAQRVPLPGYPYQRVRCWVEPDMELVPAGQAAPVVRPAPADATRREIDEWIQAPVWRQLAPRAVADPAPRCLAFTAGPRGDRLVDALRAAGTEVVEVRPGDAFAADADGYRLRPAAPEDYVRLAGAGVPERVVHAWALDARDSQDTVFFSLLHLVQAAIAAGATGDARVHVDAVTAGAYEVVGGDAVDPAGATVAGIALTAGHESGSVTVRHVDIDADADIGADLTAPAARRLCDALWRDPADEPDRPLALRRGRAWVRDFEPVTVPDPGHAGHLRDNGVYLITGGLGALGLAIADDLAVRVSARLVLVGRAGLPPRAEWDGPLGRRAARAVEAVRRMEAAGAQVLAVAADVSDAGDLRRVREETLARFGRLDGIVHAAGVPGSGMIEARSRDDALAVLAPKVAGTLALRAVFGDLPMDFVALFSSLAAVLPSIGDVDYIGANAFLDAEAAVSAGPAGGWAAPVRSLGWCGWRDIGMAAEAAGLRADPDGDAATGGTPIDHPVLTVLHPARPGRPAYCAGTVSAGTHWVLDEHRLTGTPVLPGTGQLELVRAAVAAVVPAPDGRHVVELRDVAFVQPFAVPAGSTAEVRVEVDGADVTVVSIVDGERRVHTSGTAAWVPVDADPVDLDAIRRRCPDPAVVEVEGGRMLAFGPRWHSVREAWAGSGEQLVGLTAPDAALADLDRWPLHPALLDVATMPVSGPANGPEAGPAALPIGYGRLVVHDRIPARSWAHLRATSASTAPGVRSFDLTVVADDGRVLVSVTDFMLRPVDLAAVTTTVTTPAAPAPSARAAAQIAAGDDLDSVMISPVDAVEVFHRAMSADLTPHVLIDPIPFRGRLRRSTDNARRLLARLRGEETAAGEDTDAGSDPPAVVDPDDLVAVVGRVWADVLDLDDVDVDDDFFAVGGNSLVAIQVLAQIRKATGVRLPMRALFDAPTVAGVAARVADLRAANAVPDPAPAPEAAPEPQPATAPAATTIPRLARSKGQA